jgi:hypothetical protein
MALQASRLPVWASEARSYLAGEGERPNFLHVIFAPDSLTHTNAICTANQPAPGFSCQAMGFNHRWLARHARVTGMSRVSLIRRWVSTIASLSPVLNNAAGIVYLVVISPIP